MFIVKLQNENKNTFPLKCVTFYIIFFEYAHVNKIPQPCLRWLLIYIKQRFWISLRVYSYHDYTTQTSQEIMMLIIMLMNLRCWETKLEIKSEFLWISKWLTASISRYIILHKHIFCISWKLWYTFSNNQQFLQLE